MRDLDGTADATTEHDYESLDRSEFPPAAQLPKPLELLVRKHHV